MEHRDTGAMRAFVLHPDIQSAPTRRDPAAALEEAVALARALPDLDVVGSSVVRLSKAQPGLLFGRGKIEELGQRFKADDIGLVLVDGPVSPVQQRNLEKEWKVKLLDRTGLILEIFADRARTREGVLQVELAALSYQRTRLVRAWTHLERQRGGLGFVGGPGETQIEADRRAIDEAITRLRRQLAKVVKTRALHRAARAKVPYPIVALVGYTNAGKSTLFNRLTGADVMAKDMLFATLDPTMRGVALPDGTDVILSDTVGFISDLPTQLVAAFRATLEEVLAADIVLHVRDIAHPESEEQAQDVRAILGDLGLDEDVPLLEIWNKIDAVDAEARAPLENRAMRDDGVLIVSALTGEGLEAFTDTVAERLGGVKRQDVVDLPFSAGRARAWLFDQGVVEAEEQLEQGLRFRVTWTDRQKARFAEIGA
ncbi:MAG: GTPase HflX [Pseudomonadota bacterium]